MRVLSLNWNYGMCSARYWRAGASQPSRTSGSDFSIYRYITGAVIPIQRQHAHKIATSGTRNKEDASRFRKRGGRGDTIIQTPK